MTFVETTFLKTGNKSREKAVAIQQPAPICLNMTTMYFLGENVSLQLKLELF